MVEVVCVGGLPHIAPCVRLGGGSYLISQGVCLRAQIQCRLTAVEGSHFSFARSACAQQRRRR